MSRLERLGLVIVLCSATAGPAAASDFDGSRKLLCAPSDVMECGAGGDCQRVTLEAMNIPRFIHVDFKKKRLSGETETGEETTAVQNVQKVDGRTILQGAERGRGWSLVIDQETGHMSGAIAGDDIGFVLLGACTPR
jgi:hypothetical protein